MNQISARCRQSRPDVADSFHLLASLPTLNPLYWALLHSIAHEVEDQHLHLLQNKMKSFGQVSLSLLCHFLARTGLQSVSDPWWSPSSSHRLLHRFVREPLYISDIVGIGRKIWHKAKESSDRSTIARDWRTSESTVPSADSYRFLYRSLQQLEQTEAKAKVLQLQELLLLNSKSQPSSSYFHCIVSPAKPHSHVQDSNTHNSLCLNSNPNALSKNIRSRLLEAKLRPFRITSIASLGFLWFISLQSHTIHTPTSQHTSHREVQHRYESVSSSASEVPYTPWEPFP